MQIVAEEGVEVPSQPQAPPTGNNIATGSNVATGNNAGVQFFEARPVFGPGPEVPAQVTNNLIILLKMQKEIHSFSAQIPLANKSVVFRLPLSLSHRYAPHLY